MKRDLLIKLSAVFLAVLTVIILLPAPTQAATRYAVLRVTKSTKLLAEPTSLTIDLRAVYKGEELLFLRTDGDFYEVMDKAGNSGFVYISNVTNTGDHETKDSFLTCPAYTVTGGSCSFSKKPGDNGSGSGHCNEGETVLLAYKYSSSLYCVLTKNYKFIFVSSSRLSATGQKMTYKELKKGVTPPRTTPPHVTPTRTTPPRVTPTRTTPPRVTPTPTNRSIQYSKFYPVFIVIENSYIYTSPSTSGSTKRHLWRGEEVLCIEKQGKFYRILEATGVEGYVLASTLSYGDYDDTPDYFLVRPIYLVNSYSCKYYSQPGTAAKGTLDYGTNILIICQYSDELIYGRLSNGKFIFVKLRDLMSPNITMTYEQLHGGVIIRTTPPTTTPPTNGPTPGKVYVVATTAARHYIFMYDQPSSSRGNNIGTYKNGTQCTFVSKSKDGWWKVRFGSKVGYVRSKDLVPA